MKYNQKQLEQAIAAVSRTDNGKALLFVLCEECGFLSNRMHATEPVVTQAEAAKRGVYAKLRKHIPKEHLIDIEHNISLTAEKESDK